jgi:hypothetical protein
MGTTRKHYSLSRIWGGQWPVQVNKGGTARKPPTTESPDCAYSQPGLPSEAATTNLGRIWKSVAAPSFNLVERSEKTTKTTSNAGNVMETLPAAVPRTVPSPTLREWQMKPNGWLCLGIIASVIGALVCARLGLKMQSEPLYAAYLYCMGQGWTGYSDDIDTCQRTLDAGLAHARSQSWYIGLLFALIPLATAWIIALTLVGLVRWVRQGFRT